jgi:hypothetical protein
MRSGDRAELLKTIFPKHRYVSLDDPMLREQVAPGHGLDLTTVGCDAARPVDADLGTASGAADDVISPTIAWSTADGYGVPASPATVKGTAVPAFVDGADDRRTMWFRIMTPLLTTTTDQQTIPAEIDARENTSAGLLAGEPSRPQPEPNIRMSTP